MTLLRDELVMDMRLLGVASVEELSPGSAESATHGCECVDGSRMGFLDLDFTIGNEVGNGSGNRVRTRSAKL